MLGLLGGIVVGMTSVGSGSLIIIALMALYPTLKASELVGTDLVQAVPLVASAALGHILFGDFPAGPDAVTAAGLHPRGLARRPPVRAGPGGLVRRALAFVLLASALKLLNVSNKDTGAGYWPLVVVIAPVLWMLVRRRHGFPAFVRRAPIHEPQCPQMGASTLHRHVTGSPNDQTLPTRRGLRRSVVVPSPIWPLKLAPQQ